MQDLTKISLRVRLLAPLPKGLPLSGSASFFSGITKKQSFGKKDVVSLRSKPEEFGRGLDWQKCLGAFVFGFMLLGGLNVSAAESEASIVEKEIAESGFPVVSFEQVKAVAGKDSHFILDARPKFDYVKKGHLPGALNMPEDNLDDSFGELQGAHDLISGIKPIIVYCSGNTCDAALIAAKFLRDLGIPNVSIYTNGFTEWTEKKGTIEK